MNKRVEKDIVGFLMSRESDIALEMEDFGCLKFAFNYYLGRPAENGGVKVYSKIVTRDLKKRGLL